MEANVLITTIGRKVPLAKAFKEALSGDYGIKGRVVTVDAGTLAAGLYESDAWYQVPRVNDPAYVPSLLDICRKEEIRMVVPLFEAEFPILDENRDSFKQVGAQLILSPRFVLSVCQDKLATYSFFEKNNIPTPKSYLPEYFPIEETVFPVFMKPRCGMGSINAYKINNPEEFRFFSNYIPNLLVQEFIEGTEYTLDILADLQGKVVSVVPRVRIETRAGEVSKSKTVYDETMIKWGVIITEKLGAVGPVTMQCIVTPDQDIKFIEINPRFGGGFALTFAAGGNYPLLLARMVAGEPLGFEGLLSFKPNLTMLRYDEALFFEDL
ncbi:MAG: ATP-grasp domain-containing protein [Clostridia bacterium]|nr:ATP-grasp domain-containing protein [Clostridia bacterium]